MEEDSIPTNEENITLMFDKVNYYQRSMKLDLRFAYLIACIVYKNNQAGQFLEEKTTEE